MSTTFEAIYSDLYGIARHIGPLDEDAVKGAGVILSFERYRRASEPARLLAADLIGIIEGLPDDAGGEDRVEGDARASETPVGIGLRTSARRYFSREGTGQTLTNRRKLGGEKLSGSTAKWMNYGTLYRVAAGLYELQVLSQREAQGPTYRITSEHLARYVRHELLPVRDILTYDLCELTDGSHSLRVPFSFQDPKPVLVPLNLPVENPKPYPQIYPADRFSESHIYFEIDKRMDRDQSIRIEVRSWSLAQNPLQLRHSPLGISEKLTLELHLPSKGIYDYAWEYEDYGTKYKGICDGRWVIDAPARCDHVLRAIARHKSRLTIGLDIIRKPGI